MLANLHNAEYTGLTAYTRCLKMNFQGLPFQHEAGYGRKRKPVMAINRRLFRGKNMIKITVKDEVIESE